MYYVCENYGCIWSGSVDQMIENYLYPQNSTWYFDTMKEAVDYENHLRGLREEQSEDIASLQEPQYYGELAP